MKKNILLSLALIATAATANANMFSVTVDASQFPTRYCANNSIVVAKGLYPNIGGSSVLANPALCEYAGVTTPQVIGLFDTARDFSGYPFLVISSKQSSALVLKGTCTIANFKNNGTVAIKITAGSGPDPIYSVTCNYGS